MSKVVKPKIVIIEGAQGVGKTTLTNLLRDKMPYSNLMRLSGIKDKSGGARTKVVNIYYSLMSMLEGTKGTDMNWIFDRTFLTERVYAMLGYKDYTFEDDYRYFMGSLEKLCDHYDVYVLVLTTTEEKFEERLNRDKPQYGAVKFKAGGSMRQQEAYLALLKDIERNYRGIDVMEIPTTFTDPMDIAYDIVEAINR